MGPPKLEISICSSNINMYYEIHKTSRFPFIGMYRQYKITILHTSQIVMQVQLIKILHINTNMTYIFQMSMEIFNNRSIFKTSTSSTTY